VSGTGRSTLTGPLRLGSTLAGPGYGAPPLLAPLPRLLLLLSLLLGLGLHIKQLIALQRLAFLLVGLLLLRVLLQLGSLALLRLEATTDAGGGLGTTTRLLGR
jgi:hypothetical protein